MITVTAPEHFTTIPWKNGLGYTTELAISAGSTLDNFSWRLSIATVANDGIFSDFSGYQRDLVLIEGNGITLEHDGKSTDNLTKLLDVAHFDGGCTTHGKLHNGTIKDFNTMVKQGEFTAKVDTYTAHQQVTVSSHHADLIFVYSLSAYIRLEQAKLQMSVPTGSLAFIDNQHTQSREEVNITGENLIVIQLSKVSH